MNQLIRVIFRNVNMSHSYHLSDDKSSVAKIVDGMQLKIIKHIQIGYSMENKEEMGKKRTKKQAQNNTLDWHEEWKWS